MGRVLGRPIWALIILFVCEGQFFIMGVALWALYGTYWSILVPIGPYCSLLVPVVALASALAHGHQWTVTYVCRRSASLLAAGRQSGVPG